MLAGVRCLSCIFLAIKSDMQEQESGLQESPKSSQQAFWRATSGWQAAMKPPGRAVGVHHQLAVGVDGSLTAAAGRGARQSCSVLTE